MAGSVSGPVEDCEASRRTVRAAMGERRQLGIPDTAVRSGVDCRRDLARVLSHGVSATGPAFRDRDSFRGLWARARIFSSARHPHDSVLSVRVLVVASLRVAGRPDGRSLRFEHRRVCDGAHGRGPVRADIGSRNRFGCNSAMSDAAKHVVQERLAAFARFDRRPLPITCTSRQRRRWLRRAAHGPPLGPPTEVGPGVVDK
jgi:hypothetical protein